MDSKNLLWLGSFFSLLFITFCVTRHLDDLNPNITSITYEKQELSSELETINLGNTTQDFVAPKLEVPKLEVPKLEVPKLEVPKLVKEKTERFSTEALQITLPKKEKIVLLKEPTKHKKTTVIKKPTKKKKKVMITKMAKQKSHIKKPYIIGGINIDDYTMQEIFNHQNNNELNKLAYMHSINKDSIIQVSTSDSQIAHAIKQYLQKQNVKNKDIKINTREHTNGLINLTLIGRK